MNGIAQCIVELAQYIVERISDGSQAFTGASVRDEDRDQHRQGDLHHREPFGGDAHGSLTPDERRSSFLEFGDALAVKLQRCVNRVKAFGDLIKAAVYITAQIIDPLVHVIKAPVLDRYANPQTAEHRQDDGQGDLNYRQQLGSDVHLLFNIAQAVVRR